MNILVEYFQKGCISVTKHVLAQWGTEMKERERRGRRRGEQASSEITNYQTPPHVNDFLLKSSDGQMQQRYQTRIGFAPH